MRRSARRMIVRVRSRAADNRVLPGRMNSPGISDSRFNTPHFFFHPKDVLSGDPSEFIDRFTRRGNFGHQSVKGLLNMLDL